MLAGRVAGRRATGGLMDTERVGRLEVDRIRCDGYGMCAELLPEVIELDDWGYPIIVSGDVPDELRSLARRAVDVCPVLALRLSARPVAQTSGA
jgi:ferredoxin